MGDPIITVLITCYNYEQYVAEAIESALGQGPGVDVVVVDDGSTDGSAAVIADYLDSVDFVAQPNGGQAAAFNTGIARAKGDIVQILDADDRLAPGAIQRLREAAVRAPEAAVFFHPLQYMDENSRPMTGGLPEADRQLPSGDLRGRVLDAPDDIPWQPASGMAIRTDVLRAISPVPESRFRLCADAYIANTASLHGLVAVVDEVGGYYRVHGSNSYHRSNFDVSRAIDTIARTADTHEAIERSSVELGLSDGKLRFRSVTDVAAQAAVMRLDPAAATHNPTVRTRRDALVHGVGAALARDDLGVSRRVAMVGWFAAVCVVPRSLVPWLAEQALTR